MNPAPASGRTADENELREEISRCLWEHGRKVAMNSGPHWNDLDKLEMEDRLRRMQVLGFADALLSGPLAPILQEAATARKERDEERRENDYLRASLANGAGPCAYCKLPKEDWVKCADGFPGCARGDDAMLCPHVGSWLDYGEKLEAAEQEAATLRAQLRESAMQHIARDLGDEQAWTEIATLRARLQEAEKGRPPVIEFHQQDWIPGFAAFLPGATTPQPDSRAFCVLNLGSMLSTVANGDVPASDLPAFIVESMIHEVGHVLEQWAGVEFSEERVEALCDRYRAALNPNQEAGDHEPR